MAMRNRVVFMLSSISSLFPVSAVFTLLLTGGLGCAETATEQKLTATETKASGTANKASGTADKASGTADKAADKSSANKLVGLYKISSDHKNDEGCEKATEPFKGPRGFVAIQQVSMKQPRVVQGRPGYAKVTELWIRSCATEKECTKWATNPFDPADNKLEAIPSGAIHDWRFLVSPKDGSITGIPRMGMGSFDKVSGRCAGLSYEPSQVKWTSPGTVSLQRASHAGDAAPEKKEGCEEAFACCNETLLEKVWNSLPCRWSRYVELKRIADVPAYSAK